MLNRCAVEETWGTQASNTSRVILEHSPQGEGLVQRLPESKDWEITTLTKMFQTTPVLALAVPLMLGDGHGGCCSGRDASCQLPCA